MSNELNSHTENKKVIAVYDYNGSDLQKNLLSFKKGDILEIIECNETNWWRAKDSTGKIALIPANYTKEVLIEYTHTEEKLETGTPPNDHRPIKKVIKINTIKKQPNHNSQDNILSTKPKKLPPKPPNSNEIPPKVEENIKEEKIE